MRHFCPTCPLDFASRQALVSHQKTHTQARKDAAATTVVLFALNNSETNQAAAVSKRQKTARPSQTPPEAIDESDQVGVTYDFSSAPEMDRLPSLLASPSQDSNDWQPFFPSYTSAIVNDATLYHESEQQVRANILKSSSVRSAATVHSQWQLSDYYTMAYKVVGSTSNFQSEATHRLYNDLQKKNVKADTIDIFLRHYSHLHNDNQWPKSAAELEQQGNGDLENITLEEVIYNNSSRPIIGRFVPGIAAVLLLLLKDDNINNYIIPSLRDGFDLEHSDYYQKDLKIAMLDVGLSDHHPLVIKLYSDATEVGNFSSWTFHPVYMTLANFPLHVQLSRAGKIPVGWIPQIDGDDSELKAFLWHAVIALILYSLDQIQRSGLLILYTDIHGHPRSLATVPTLSQTLADMPEFFKMALLRRQQCRSCPKGDFSSKETFHIRDYKSERDLRRRKAAGEDILLPDEFYPNVTDATMNQLAFDKYSQPPDPQHTFGIGLQKYIWKISKIVLRRVYHTEAGVDRFLKDRLVTVHFLHTLDRISLNFDTFLKISKYSTIPMAQRYTENNYDNFMNGKGLRDSVKVGELSKWLLFILEDQPYIKDLYHMILSYWVIYFAISTSIHKRWPGYFHYIKLIAEDFEQRFKNLYLQCWPRKDTSRVFYLPKGLALEHYPEYLYKFGDIMAQSDCRTYEGWHVIVKQIFLCGSRQETDIMHSTMQRRAWTSVRNSITPSPTSSFQHFMSSHRVKNADSTKRVWKFGESISSVLRNYGNPAEANVVWSLLHTYYSFQVQHVHILLSMESMEQEEILHAGHNQIGRSETVLVASSNDINATSSVGHIARLCLLFKATVYEERKYWALIQGFQPKRDSAKMGRLPIVTLDPKGFRIVPTNTVIKRVGLVSTFPRRKNPEFCVFGPFHSSSELFSSSYLPRNAGEPALFITHVLPSYFESVMEIPSHHRTVCNYRALLCFAISTVHVLSRSSKFVSGMLSNHVNPSKTLSLAKELFQQIGVLPVSSKPGTQSDAVASKYIVELVQSVGFTLAQHDATEFLLNLQDKCKVGLESSDPFLPFQVTYYDIKADLTDKTDGCLKSQEITELVLRMPMYSTDIKAARTLQSLLYRFVGPVLDRDDVHQMHNALRFIETAPVNLFVQIGDAYNQYSVTLDEKNVYILLLTRSVAASDHDMETNGSVKWEQYAAMYRIVATCNYWPSPFNTSRSTHGHWTAFVTDSKTANITYDYNDNYYDCKRFQDFATNIETNSRLFLMERVDIDGSDCQILADQNFSYKNLLL